MLIVRVLTGLILGVATSVLVLSLYGKHLLEAPISLPADQYYLIRPGTSLIQITQDLTRRGIVTAPERLLRYYALYTREEGYLQAGEYQLSETDSAVSMLALFRSGRVVQRQVTFPEGWRFDDWRRHLAATEFIRQTLPQVPDQEVMSLVGGSGAIPEGWFFPDTYSYVRGESDVAILRRAYRKMVDELDSAWSARSVGDVLQSSHEALTLASIIEKETGTAEERGLIARVFINRLEQNIRLQSDPTVIYGMGDEFEGDLTRRALNHESPYNTYRVRGLPPAPIAMPGRESILAALHPESGPYLYFVAKGDGTSHFSSSLDEHNRAVEQYQRSGRRDDYQSTPQ